MKSFILKDGKEIEIVESLAGYMDDKIYHKIKLPNGNYKILSDEHLTEIIQPNSDSVLSGNEKLSLYFDYFKGRPDVYAIKYYNKFGKPGFNPHGNFEWHEIHDKKTGKNKWQKHYTSYFPYTLETVKKHILGSSDINHGAGIYPMLPDDTCYLLVMDFDNDNAEKDALSIVDTSIKYDIPLLIERSQSGKGIHLWFFFKTNIKARSARKFGSLLISATMSQNRSVTFENFDRMIPMQDTLTANGFGNLIALPLRWEKVKEGKTVFLNDKFQSIENQWEHLKSIDKISKEQLHDHISKLSRYGSELPVKDDMIENLDITLSGEIMLHKKELSHEDFMRMANLATFKNPEFYKRQNMRASTWDTPQYVTAAREDENHLYLPRGLYSKIQETTEDLNTLNQLSSGHHISVTFKGNLNGEQQHALNTLLSNDQGVLHAATGFGKTVVATNLIAEKKLSTLILVNSKVLADQWKQRLDEFLVIDSEPFKEYTPTGRIKKKDSVGKIYGSKVSQSKVIDIALFQTLSNRSDLAEFFKDYGLVIVDEAHHLGAKSFEDVIRHASSKYLYGLTATPERKDGLSKLITLRLGNIIFEHSESESDKVLLPKYYYPRFTNYAEFAKDNSYHEHIDSILNDTDRNTLIIEDVMENVNQNRNCLIITERIAHIKNIIEKISNHNLPVKIIELTGQGKKSENESKIAQMNELESPFIVLSTGKYIGEGFDSPNLDTIFLALPISWKGRLKQYLGRLQRNVANKDELRVYDYIDIGIPMFSNMYQKRLRVYRSLRFQLAEDQKTKEMETRMYTQDDYSRELLSDLHNGSRVMICVPFLSNRIVKVINDLRMSYENIVLITRKSTSPNGKKHLKQHRLLDEVSEFNINHSTKDKIPQSFIIIDNNIVWYGSINFFNELKEDAYSLRIVNTRIASQIINNSK